MMLDTTLIKQVLVVCTREGCGWTKTVSECEDAYDDMLELEHCPQCKEKVVDAL